MIFLELTRMETGSSGTIGVLSIDKCLFCYILEPPKKNNIRGESCIPTGQYMCKRYDSEKYKCPCIAIHDVPGRSHISMHFGNTLDDTAGCLITGTYTGFLNGKRAVLRSKEALNALMSEIKDTCHITIREAF